MLRHRLEQLLGSALLDRRARRAEAQREQRRDPEPEGERHRRAGQENVAGLWANQVLREGVARREHIAMELDAALRDAGGAAGESDDARVVAAGVCRWQRLQRRCARLQLALPVVAVIFDDV